MARIPREHRLETPDARAKLKARSEPYWRQIIPGTFIGYRKGKRGAAWIVRQRQGDNYAEQRIGTPDDVGEHDGDVVLTYAQAVALAQRTQVEKRAPAPRHYGDGQTLNDVFDEYLTDRQTTPGGRFNRVMPASTAEITRGSWNLRVKDSIGKSLVTALDAATLRRWHAGMVRMAPTNRGKELEFDHEDPAQLRARQNTANRVLTIVKATLNWARQQDRLPSNMADFWRTTKAFSLADEGEPRMLDQGEITRLLNAAPPDLRELLSGALMTGARYGELCALRVRDWDTETRTIRLYQSKTYKTLRQPLTAEGVILFDRLTAGRSPDAPIFTRADGSAWNQSDAAKPMRAAAAAAKLEDVSFKVTRATYGKLLLVATKDIEMVARALGHSDSRITRKHYARYLPNELARAVATLPALGIETGSKVSRIRGKKRPTA